MCLRQDPHRSRTVNWMKAAGGTCTAFDMTTKGILHQAFEVPPPPPLPPRAVLFHAAMSNVVALKASRMCHFSAM